MWLADRLDRSDHIRIASPDVEIILEPAQVVKRIAVEELTAAQKRQVYASLAEGPADGKAGRIHGHFASAKEASAQIECGLRERKHSKND